MSAATLKTGERFNLNNAVSTDPLRVEIVWALGDASQKPDVDASVFVCEVANGAKTIISDEYFVFYNNKVSPDGAVTHQGDTIQGTDGAPDKQVIRINLAKLSRQAQEVRFFVTIHRSGERGQTFADVPTLGVRLYNDTTGAELARYDVEQSLGDVSSVLMATVLRETPDAPCWFEAAGEGSQHDLGELVDEHIAD
ncbi:TerD family protein [Burkholderia cepacia]|uniref:TerD family protein n=1 Tax=Burkholderia cepacia TaxID=292 RepID=UPI00157B9A8F|nr:TerD family protein [Burkholderia cepacia]